MDVRLHDIVTGFHRARRLTREDLPLVSRALTAAILGTGAAIPRLTRHNKAVELVLGTGETVVVLKEDWEKIWPFIEDGTFNPQVIPTRPRGVVLRSPGDGTNLNWKSTGLYSLILSTLTPLFPEYPTNL